MKTIKKLFSAFAVMLMLASASPVFAQGGGENTTTTTTRTTEDEDYGKYGLAGLLGLLGLLGLKKKNNDVHVHRNTGTGSASGIR